MTFKEQLKIIHDNSDHKYLLQDKDYTYDHFASLMHHIAAHLFDDIPQVNFKFVRLSDFTLDKLSANPFIKAQIASEINDYKDDLTLNADGKYDIKDVLGAILGIKIIVDNKLDNHVILCNFGKYKEGMFDREKFSRRIVLIDIMKDGLRIELNPIISTLAEDVKKRAKLLRILRR